MSAILQTREGAIVSSSLKKEMIRIVRGAHNGGNLENGTMFNTFSF